MCIFKSILKSNKKPQNKTTFPFPLDVMSELLKLMTDVADQRPGTMGKQWQHPSDLTRRYVILIGFSIVMKWGFKIVIRQT